MNAGWNGQDGFSPIPAIMTYFANVSIANCPRLWDIGASLAEDSPTILLNADTGEKIPHWVELDHNSDAWESGSYDRMLMVWPAERLNGSSRYIVAFRNLVDHDGQPVGASPAFRALRDDIPSKDPNVNERRALFESLFATVTAAAGVKRKSLQLLWDFTVASTPGLTNNMLFMRDDALRRVSSGISYEIDFVEEKPKDGVARRIHGHYYVPLYLNTPEPLLSSRLVLDDNGVPVFQRLYPVNFTLQIPTSLANGTEKGRVLQYGHGLFGSRSEIDSGYLIEESNKFNYVIGATNWLGLCEEDVVTVALMVATSFDDLLMVPDRLHQGMLNALVLTRLMITELPKDPVVHFQGRSVMDPTLRNYYGNSLGGIMGSVFMSLTQDIERGVLGVPGGPFGLLLPRSVDFDALYDILRVRYLNPLDRIALMNVMQMLFNKLEPAGYLHGVSRHPFPNTPRHRVMLHYGIGDAQVTWLGAQVMARSIGNPVKMYSSNVRVGNETLFGFDFVSDDTVLGNDTSLIQGWDFGAPKSNIPFVNLPAAKATDAHELPRRTSSAQLQNHRFFVTGEIYNACGGPCKKQ